MTNLAILDESVKLDDGAVQDFDPPHSILRRLRADCEAQMTSDFNLPLSHTIDGLVQQEEALSLLGEEGRP